MSSLDQETQTLPLEAALAFAPLHKRHFGTAIGLATGLLVAGATVVDIFATPGYNSLYLLSQFFYGYEVTWGGVVVGGLWAFFVGWIGGWFVAFCRNFVLAAMVFWVRTKANLAASRDFLDHI